MACDKSRKRVISGFQELVATVPTDCVHSLFTSHFLLFFKISNKTSHFQDFHSKKGFCEVKFICKMHQSKSQSEAAAEKSVPSSGTENAAAVVVLVELEELVAKIV